MAKVKAAQASDKLSKSLKAQIVALIEKANTGAHKAIAKLEKQVLALSPKKAKAKDKPKALKAKKKASAKKTAEQAA